MSGCKFSIVIPAHDEEKFIGRCLRSIRDAAKAAGASVETIVVLNRCNDGTERVANEWGANVVVENSRNLARIRNCGAAHATGNILVTIDADSWMSPNMLSEIGKALHSGKYIGGAVKIRMERMSVGLFLTMAFLRISMWVMNLGGGLFWCSRKDFEAVGRFNERCTFGEDLDFAKRLKAYGRQRQKRFTTLRKAYIVTSARKFDRLGDWFALKLVLFKGRKAMREFRGGGHTFADEYFYDYKR